MSQFTRALRAEARKALNSPLLWFAGAAVLLFPAIGAGFMLIVRDPDGARSLGLIGTKARLSGLTADWPSFLGFMNQAMASGYLFLEALVVSWVFGREWSDRTLKLLLAVPAGRGTIVAAKFSVIALWALGTLAALAGTAIGVGTVLGLPLGSETLLFSWAGHFAAGGLLTAVLGTWTGFFASWGRGYLVPIAWTLATLVTAQLGVVLGWSPGVPWAVPALAAGVAGPAGAAAGSVALVLLTAALGAMATARYWARADHHR